MVLPDVLFPVVMSLFSPVLFLILFASLNYMNLFVVYQLVVSSVGDRRLDQYLIVHLMGR